MEDKEWVLKNKEEIKELVLKNVEEIKEIMNGNRAIKHLRIEGETLGFDTQFHNNWNFMPRDIEQIIYTLQQELSKANDKLEKIEDKLYCWGEVLDPEFQKIMLEIIKEREMNK